MVEGLFKPLDPEAERAAVRDVINEVFSVENLLMRGILTKQQAFQITRAMSLAELWSERYPRTSSLIVKVCDNLLKASVSTKGQSNGRDGLQQALASVVSVSTSNKEMMGKDSRLWGGMGPRS